MKLFDCTLRDGANVVGKGFNAELTKMMIEGLIKSGQQYQRCSQGIEGR